MRISRFVFCVSCGLAAIGCSGGGAADVPTTTPVTVKVTLDGQPLAKANVSFFPVSQDGKNAPAMGQTDEQGSAKLLYKGSIEGAVPGPYQIIVSKWVDRQGNALVLDNESNPATLLADGAKELLPPVYSSPEKTTLTATVGPNGGTFDLPLKSKP